MTPLLVYYLLAVNLATFIAYGIDKLKARRNGGRGSRQQTRRIPEASLLLLAALCHDIVCTGQKSFSVLSEDYGVSVPNMGSHTPFEIAGRAMRLWRMPS